MEQHLNKQITKMRSWIQANPVFAAAVIIGSISVLLAVAFLAEPANDVAAASGPVRSTT